MSENDQRYSAYICCFNRPFNMLKQTKKTPPQKPNKQKNTQQKTPTKIPQKPPKTKKKLNKPLNLKWCGEVDFPTDILLP